MVLLLSVQITSSTRYHHIAELWQWQKSFTVINASCRRIKSDQLLRSSPSDGLALQHFELIYDFLAFLESGRKIFVTVSNSREHRHKAGAAR
jgi:hypothetical protein